MPRDHPFITCLKEISSVRNDAGNISRVSLAGDLGKRVANACGPVTAAIRARRRAAGPVIKSGRSDGVTCSIDTEAIVAMNALGAGRISIEPVGATREFRHVNCSRIKWSGRCRSAG